MDRGVDRYALTKVSSEFRDPEIERAFRQQEVERLQPKLPFYILIGAIAWCSAIALDLVYFVGELADSRTYLLSLRLLPLVVAVPVVLFLRGRPTPARLYYGVLGLLALFAGIYTCVAHEYVTVLGRSDNPFYYAVLAFAYLVGFSFPIRFNVLIWLSALLAGLYLHAVWLPWSLAGVGRFLVAFAVASIVGAVFAIRSARSNRLAYARAAHEAKRGETLANEVARRAKFESELRHQQQKLEEVVKERTAELRQREQQYRMLAENSGDIIARVDLDHRLQYVNQAFGVMLGASLSDPIGAKISELDLPAENIELLEHAVQTVFDKGASYATQIEVQRPRGMVTIDWRMFPELGAGGKVQSVLAAARDVTKLRMMQHEKQALEQQLVQSQKLEAIGRLAAGVAHDFNNLLTPILGYAELAQHDPAEVAEALREIKGAGKRARQLTRQLLAFSRKQVLDVQPTDIHGLVDSFEAMLRRLLRENIDLQCHLDASNDTIAADAAQIEQILMNLAVNAGDAMPDGGRIIITTSDLKIEKGKPAHGAASQLPAGRYLVLSVKDTGCGISEEVQRKVFEPFFTTKERGKGTGLGLATVYGIVTQHGGVIDVESAPGEGTTFTIIFPLIDERSRAEKQLERPILPQRGTETILLVEDDGAVRRLSLTVLKRQGYNVLVATNGQEALSLSKKHRGAIDLLLTDLIIPDLNGVQVWNAHREINPNSRVMFMSGYADEVLDQAGLTSADLHFLHKPFSIDDLLLQVRQSLDAPADAMPSPDNPDHSQ